MVKKLLCMVNIKDWMEGRIFFFEQQNSLRDLCRKLGLAAGVARRSCSLCESAMWGAEWEKKGNRWCRPGRICGGEYQWNFGCHNVACDAYRNMAVKGESAWKRQKAAERAAATAANQAASQVNPGGATDVPPAETCLLRSLNRNQGFHRPRKRSYLEMTPRAKSKHSMLSLRS